ncbi:cupin domain-containing protein [Aquisalimonas sp.]|uniref:cupin domain-containing protein n=1 Tax=Aquisalimonas sp. TaxID=1872621 RepID=UPI0025BBD520|nr:cupin domain-containing protein [Aquisalimonas sp.]
MQHFVPTPPQGITDLVRTPHSKAQTIVLAPQEQVGGPDNRLSGADRWIYVLSGIGRCAVNDEAVDLVAGVVVLVEAGEPLTLKNNGDEALDLLVIFSSGDG